METLGLQSADTLGESGTARLELLDLRRELQVLALEVLMPELSLVLKLVDSLKKTLYLALCLCHLECVLFSELEHLLLQPSSPDFGGFRVVLLSCAKGLHSLLMLAVRLLKLASRVLELKLKEMDLLLLEGTVLGKLVLAELGLLGSLAG